VKDNDKMFRLPSDPHMNRIFRKWLELAGIDHNRVTLHNSRSTAISLLINKGVPEFTQERGFGFDPNFIVWLISINFLYQIYYIYSMAKQVIFFDNKSTIENCKERLRKYEKEVL